MQRSRCARVRVCARVWVQDGAESGGATGDDDLALKEAVAAAAAALLPGVVRVTCVQDLPRFDMPLLLGTFRCGSACG